ncbi:MAG: HemK/PrmC family methyltransferase [Fibrobacteria bacterium]
MIPASAFTELLAEVEKFWVPLPDKPEETAAGVLSALWLAAAGTPKAIQQALQSDLGPLDDAAGERLRGLIEQKKSGVPLAHLTGRQEFLGLELLSGPGALIPRRETEIVGKAALARIKTLAAERGSLLVVDVCTGSGNLALAYAHHEPRAKVFGADLSEEAVALARRNAGHLGLPVEFRAGDLLAPYDNDGFVGKLDFLSCNPPYISAAKVPHMHKEISGFEPELAFNGGAFGVSVLTKLLKNAPRFLKPASWLGFEVGLGQGPALAKQLGKNPAFAEVETYADEAGEIRALLARTV